MGNIRNCHGGSEGLALPLVASELLFFFTKIQKKEAGCANRHGNEEFTACLKHQAA